MATRKIASFSNQSRAKPKVNHDSTRYIRDISSCTFSYVEALAEVCAYVFSRAFQGFVRAFPLDISCMISLRLLIVSRDNYFVASLRPAFGNV